MLNIQTKQNKEIVDITDSVNKKLSELNVDDGACLLFLKHTSACLTTADLDPGTDLDMLDTFDGIIPKLKYRHHHDPDHVPDHILSSLIGNSLMIPIVSGVLDLGTWQRVVLIELNGPKMREVSCTIINC